MAKMLPFYGLQAQQVADEQLHPDWRSPDILVWRLRRVSSEAAAEAAAGGVQAAAASSQLQQGAGMGAALGAVPAGLAAVPEEEGEA
jgi:hypothetical protein